MENTARRCLRLFVLILSFLSLSEALAKAPKVCVVSFLESQLNGEIIRSSLSKIKDLGYPDAENRFEFFGYPNTLQGPGDAYSSLISCLEGGYEEVIIISHSFTSISDNNNIVYIEDEASGTLGFVNDRLFGNIDFSSQLRQITLVACKAETVYGTYKKLVAQAAKKEINLKVAPTLLLGDMFYEMGLDEAGYRSPREAAFLIAEASQDLTNPNTFCYLFSEKESTPGIKGTTCLRGHFLIQDKPYQEVKHPNDTDWLLLSWPAIPAEAAFVKAIFADPGKHRLVKQVAALGIESNYSLPLQDKGVFHHPHASRFNSITQIRVQLRLNK